MALEDLIFGLDLLKALLAECGELPSTASPYADQGKRFLREAYWDVLGRERWPFSLSPTPGIITTGASQDVTVSSISAATPAIVTLSTTIATSQAGVKFYLDANQSVYRIAAHTAGTASLTLDAAYVEDETAGSAVIFQDEYSTPTTVLKIWDPLWLRGQPWNEVPLLDKPFFEARYGRSWASGPAPIEAACEIQPSEYSASMNGFPHRLRVAPWSEDRVNLEFDYAQFDDLDFSGSGEADTPRIPREFRNVLVEFASYKLFLLKDDRKADQAILKAEQTMLKMKDQYRPAHRPQMYARPRHSVTAGLQ